MTTQTSGAQGSQGTAGTCPFTIDRPVMRQRWERLTFVHWPFEPADVQRLLPEGLAVETFDGAAWAGLVPFFMRVATPGGRRVPWVSNFCETNVRTYVRDGDGRSGIWFFSLDAARLGAIVTARATPYRLPLWRPVSWRWPSSCLPIARPEPPREQASPGVAAGVLPALSLIVSLSWPGQFLVRHTVHASPEPAPVFRAGEPVTQKHLPPSPGGEPVT